jgi:hypothetical protein
VLTTGRRPPYPKGSPHLNHLDGLLHLVIIACVSRHFLLLVFALAAARANRGLELGRLALAFVAPFLAAPEK